ncbi:uncharacterized protein BO80DRAFT_500327 [Aspergillus ibericus CBS 121593]|uniref:Uncharacterized protein n=1 Tax=Aspergillus ibericus CBS 121593 TaxID=1448316 RepID=A0A395H9H0_9EURO|nr:hypothetical protein BO80DRAFT_500327 [Aspergillus ibericus CBS 121593]RAL03538.1 hypothetical protein BO80DRAFT_500327 [Aspergillus ibericus CBS 121593]
MAMDQPALVLFGPQTSWPSHASASRIRHDLINELSLAPLAAAIQNIPDLWTSLLEIEPRLGLTEGRRPLEHLQHWIETGSLPRRDTPDEILPNGFATPFTVIIQAVEYWRCFLRGGQWPPTGAEAGTALEGMCTGFLTAVAAAVARDLPGFFDMAAVAVRLAACVGSLVDLGGNTPDEVGDARTLVVRWSSSGQEACFWRILGVQSSAYVSVLKDETSRTIIVPASEIPRTAEKLLMNGLRVHALERKGRFHHASNEDLANKLIGLSQVRADLQFPDAQDLLIPLRRNSDGTRLSEGPLHIVAIRSLLLEQVDWLSTVTGALESVVVKEKPTVLVLGCQARVCVSNDISPGSNILNAVKESVPELDTTAGVESPDNDNSIAIVGMACRFPGADSAEEFWQLLESGKSMLSVLPPNRFPTKGLRRSADATIFWGNFIQDPDQFDNRFFQISSREAASMDPQQRLILQVAYQALESSGYFDGQGNPTDTNIGCYLGVGPVDYEANINSHQPNSYSALGTLKAFVSGRVSHYFGWTGPSMTYDTACSSSMVALHSACKALLSGECTSALSGGVNVITDPALYQNLRAASLLSPTGATKAFDAAADGYSRGEGCGLFVLKKLETALADGDQVLGVIAGSALNQTQREYGTSITAPVSKSQQSLYRNVLSQAGLGPSDVTYIEAHGTGTPRGDPIECESIRNIFGSSNTGRQQTLYFGSVKGNIGHLEAGSGAAALFKSILMLQKKKIPKHVNFNTLNPHIPPLELEKLAIPTETIPWDASRRVICISNYGAAGSNGALVLREAPEASKRPTENGSLRCQLISIFAESAESLQAYCDQLLRYLADIAERDFPAVAYKLARMQNPTHKYRLSLIARSISELRSSLTVQKYLTATPSSPATPKPVVLCFGGQLKSSVGISKELYHSTPLFRHHLDRVETACQALGKTIYPYIFSDEAIQDAATLHCCLFASQYASAQSWMDVGIKVATVIGHSFGQISALCVCGVLSLEDAVKYVSERASLFDSDWSAEKGTMLALKADTQMVTRLVATSEVEIACYNGPRDVVVAGSFPAIEGFQSQAQAAGIDARRLDVARAFHSSLMDPALPQLRRIANTLTFHRPRIPIQTCTQGQSWDFFGPQLLVDHSRQPVFFHDAVQRTESQFGPCTWIEAGSSSFATTLASRTASPLNSFIPVDIGDPSPAESLANATLKLQALGYNVQFWAYHRSQRDAFRVFNLPPYQFARSKHWLEFKEFHAREKESSHPDDQDHSKLLLFVHFKDTEKRVAEFKVNSMSDYFRACVSGHAVLGHALCPASLYLELAAQAALYLCEDKPPVLPQVKDLQISAPLGLNSSASIRLLLSLQEPRRWRFSLLSTTGAEDTHHASGVIQVPANADFLASESSLYERLIGADRCNSILQDASIKSINGLVYNVFGAVVDYKDFYQGVQRISATASEASGVVSLPVTAAGIMPDSVYDPLALDNFLQVSGIHINCFRDIGRQDVYVCTAIGRLKVYQSLEKARDQLWLVYSNTKQGGSEVLESDIFAFNETTGSLTVALFGVRFAKVSVTSLTRALSTLNHGKPVQRLDSTPPPAPLSDSRGTSPDAEPDGNILLRLQQLLSRVTDCPVEDILQTNSLEALGIDSLMRSEVTAEIRQEFNLDITTDTLAKASTLLDLTTLISSSQTWPVPVIHTPSSSESHTTLSTRDSTANIKHILSLITDIPVEEIGDESTLDALGIDSLMRKEVQPELRKQLGRADIPDNLQAYSVTSLATYLADRDSGKKDLAIRTPSVASLGQEFDAREVGSTLAPERILKLDERPRMVRGNDGGFTLDELAASFEEIQGSFDQFADESQFRNFYVEVHPRQMELATAYVVEAFKSLGYPLSSMSPGESLSRSPVSHPPRHEKVMKQLYKLLQDAGLIALNHLGEYQRTAKPVASTSSADLLDAIIQDFPQHRLEHRLLSITGSKLAPCLSGELDALDLIFGDRTAKDLVSDVYHNAPVFVTGTKLLCKFLLSSLGKRTQPVKILEIGAGTGGTTADVVQCLTSSNIPFEYCFTDISPSLIAAASKKFKWCPSMEFLVLDIEQTPSLGNQYDLVISTNCIHTTRNLTTTTRNIHTLLKEGGMLCLVELTRNLPWFDLVFGLLEGWWLFNDGREHALAHERFWEESLRQAGFSHINWTTGDTKESEMLRLILSAKMAPKDDLSDTGSKTCTEVGTVTSRQTLSVYAPEQLQGSGLHGSVVLLTGGTGHLGTHVLHQLVNRADVRRVICLNRWTTASDPMQRQQRALSDKGIELSERQWEKIEVLEAKSNHTALGLQPEQYQRLRDQVTHIVHNAWPMSFKRPLHTFEPQFQTLHNLLRLCRDAKHGARLVFISSIGVIGRHPNTFANKPVPEEPMRDGQSSLGFGYIQAKSHCEQIIHRALEQDPSLQASYIRLGQTTGSRHFGLWNPEEHVPALLRTSQTIGALPQLDGSTAWLPLDIAAATVSELLLDTAPLRIVYHLENPVRQPWSELLNPLSAHLGLPIIPYKEWLRQMEIHETGSSNPARNLKEFFEIDFLHMSCGSVVMSTTSTTSVSAALRSATPVVGTQDYTTRNAWRIRVTGRYHKQDQHSMKWRTRNPCRILHLLHLLHLPPPPLLHQSPPSISPPISSTPTSEAANDVCQAIRAACLHTGFFQIIGHGVSPSTWSAAFEASRRFFAPPTEQKQKLDITKQIGFRGSDGIGTQSYGEDTVPDLKESFFIGLDTTTAVSSPAPTSGPLLNSSPHPSSKKPRRIPLLHPPPPSAVPMRFRHYPPMDITTTEQNLQLNEMG